MRCLFIPLAFAMLFFSSAAHTGDAALILRKGKKVLLQPPPLVRDDVVYIAVKEYFLALFERMAQSNFQPGDSSLTMTIPAAYLPDGLIVTLRVGDAAVQAGETTFYLPSPVIESDSVIYVPEDFFAIEPLQRFFPYERLVVTLPVFIHRHDVFLNMVSARSYERGSVRAWVDGDYRFDCIIDSAPVQADAGVLEAAWGIDESAYHEMIAHWLIGGDVWSVYCETTGKMVYFGEDGFDSEFLVYRNGELVASPSGTLRIVMDDGGTPAMGVMEYVPHENTFSFEWTSRDSAWKLAGKRISQP